MTIAKRTFTAVYRPPIRFRPRLLDRRAPIAHHIPAGPPDHAWPDDDTLLRSAEEHAAPTTRRAGTTR